MPECQGFLSLFLLILKEKSAIVKPYYEESSYIGNRERIYELVQSAFPEFFVKNQDAGRDQI